MQGEGFFGPILNPLLVAGEDSGQTFYPPIMPKAYMRDHRELDQEPLTLLRELTLSHLIEYGEPMKYDRVPEDAKAAFDKMELDSGLDTFALDNQWWAYFGASVKDLLRRKDETSVRLQVRFCDYGPLESESHPLSDHSELVDIHPDRVDYHAWQGDIDGKTTPLSPPQIYGIYIDLKTACKQNTTA